MILKMLFAALVSAGFGILFNVRGWNVFLAAINGSIGYALFYLAVPSNTLAMLFLSSAVMTLYAEVSARIRKAPATIFLATGLIPIVPGGGIYNTIFKAVEGFPKEAAVLGYETLLQTGAIATGIIVVSSVIKLLGSAKQ